MLKSVSRQASAAWSSQSACWVSRPRTQVPQRGRKHLNVNAVAHFHETAAATLTSLPSIVDSLGHHATLLYSLADAAASTTQQTSGGGGGPVDFLANGFEAFLKVLDGTLEDVGVPYSYGFAIILLTILVKAATFPLSKKSMESTVALQALQPRVKELQTKYAGDTETLQIETARLYKDAGVNPLAGCLPTLATIPVFIGLYRALTKAADDGLLTAGFFWIPSLGGPTTMTARQAGSGFSWLFPFENGAPPIGWHDAAAYLVLPVLLVVSQYVSQKIISPQSNDPSQAQSQAILKFLPLMIGWFSLNVPSGLTLYWLVNNILSTSQQLYLKSTMKVEIPPATANTVTATTTGTVIRPKEERVKKVTGKEMGARKKKRDSADEDVIDVEAEPVSAAAAASAPPPSKKDGRGEKFRARKAREAATKAKELSSTASSSSSPSSGQQSS